MAEAQPAQSQDRPTISIDWMRLISSLGLPTVLLGLLLYAGYAGMMWSADNVAKPLVDRHIKFLDRMEELAASHAKSLGEHDKALKELATAQTEIVKSLQAITKRLDETRYAEKP